MKTTFQINTQRVDNGFISVAQNDEPGVKTQKVVSLTEDDVKKALKDFIDHMFDPAPPKEVPATPTVVPTPAPTAPAKE